MTTDICMPRLSMDDAVATLVRWHVAEGSRVAVGDIIAEIESDKAMLELEAQEAGIVQRIMVPEGSNDVRPDQVLIVLEEEDQGARAAEPGNRHHTEPPAENPVPLKASPGAYDSIPTGTEHEQPSQPRGNGAGDSEVNASPLAARMASQAGLSLQSITGSGADGRVLASDVRTAVGHATPTPDTPGPARLPADGALELHGGFEPEYELQTPDNKRRVMAERLTKSKREAPHFYMSVDCRADALLALKETLAEGGRSSAKVSFNDLILKVTAQTLKRLPRLNAAWTDDGIRQFRSIDLAVAVAIEGGLITPVIRRADTKRVSEIAAEMRDLVARARDGTLLREEFQGGTFTVSNMGMHGVSQFSAVINPPQAAILAVGAARERPVAEDGLVRTAQVMSCTLSVDHRVADGVAAAEFLQTFSRYAEDPRLLLL